MNPTRTLLQDALSQPLGTSNRLTTSATEHPVEQKGNAMKMKPIFLLVVIVTFLLTVQPAAAWYYAIGGGGEGGAEAQNFTVEIGKEDIRIKGFNTFAGLAVPFILHGDGNVPDSTKDSECPHGNCDNLGDKDDGTEMGLLGKFGMEIYKSRAFVSLSLGVTRANTVELAQSNVTGDYYKESEDTDTNIVYGIGVNYMPEFFDWGLKMVFSLDIDNRRGLTGLIGWRW